MSGSWNILEAVQQEVKATSPQTANQTEAHHLQVNQISPADELQVFVF